MPSAYVTGNSLYTYTMPTYANQVWQLWNQQTATTISTQTNLVWQQWINNTQTYTQTLQTVTYANEAWNNWVVKPYAYNPKPLTEAERADIRRRAQEREARERALVERRTAARARARVLLDTVLSAEQKAELDRHGRFHVTGSKGRRYCIRAQGQSGNVDLLNADGSVQASLCAHPTYAHDNQELLPEADAWLSQLLHLSTDEDSFLAVANVHRGSLPPEVTALRQRAHVLRARGPLVAA